MTAVAMTGITKRFAGVVANDDVSFTAAPGEVHALLGENGAGKSTLMSILAGLYRPDAGTIKLDGAPVQFHAPGDAIAHGIGMVYQHFMLVPSLTVTENAMLGDRSRDPRLDAARVAAELTGLSTRYGMQVHPGALIWQLSVGEQQRVEILRLLYRGARVLIFDEPTAVLTPQESADLVRTLRHMAAEGFCIIFISHKMDEVLAVADRVTVLRRGRVVATLDAAATDRPALARLMVGRDVPRQVARPADAPVGAAEPVLEVRGLRAAGDRGLPALNGVDLHVRAGEILGIAGVAGNGQRELAEVLTGLRRAGGGSMRLQGRDMTGAGPGALVAAGVAHVPEDRLGTGLVASLDLADNLILKSYRRPPLARGPFLDMAARKRFAGQLLARYNVT
ncbi:MAG TPA: ABC transporter ATP-binding protein, partial [Chloroflexia bacterium]|nr:ABC transporter ATP-binding protein [Chloroflexia bacterium]